MSTFELGGATDDEPPTRPPGATAVGRRPPRRRRWILIALGALVLVVIALALLALPLLGVRSSGNAARSNLTQAIEALRKGNLELAQEKVASARSEVNSASSAVNGIGGDIWGVLPVASGAIDDARNLVSALDDSTGIAEIGVKLYPTVFGDQATLVTNETVDLTQLASVNDAAQDVQVRLSAAHASLEKVHGTTPVVGESVASARDAALEQVTSLQTTLDRYRPILDALPAVLGEHGDVNYLIAVMNPAELRSSGGATLSLGSMTISNGTVTFGNSGNTTDFTDNNQPITWEPVPDNPWHTQAAESKLVDASFSPNWTTSGEELLRAWQVTSGETPDALIVLDLQAIAKLFEITGPIDVPNYGKLTSANFVETLAGSYDKFDNAEKRNKINASIIPVLRNKLLEGGKFAQKAQSLVASAEGRHFVTYFRDPAVEKVISDLGLAGDLSDTTHDYIGVFSQNSNASKADYFEKRSVASDVTLNADGSADVTLTVTIDNATPPYSRPNTDPQRGYFTRWSIPGVTVYLPVGAQVTAATADGAAFTPAMQAERGRPFFQQFVTIQPDATAVVKITYHEPAAATLGADGSLRYDLAIDPHPIVTPAATTVAVHFPGNFLLPTAPEGWSTDGRTMTYQNPGLDTSPRWTLVATPLQG